MVLENDCLRGLAGKTRGDQCRKIHIRNVLGLDSLPILDLVHKCRLCLFGHVIRRGENSHVYRAYKEDFLGKQIHEDIDLPLLTLEKIAHDRDQDGKNVSKRNVQGSE